MSTRLSFVSVALFAVACSNSSNQAGPAEPMAQSSSSDVATADASMDADPGPDLLEAADEADEADEAPVADGATATLTSPDGVEGTVTFDGSGDMVTVSADVRGLKPGKHGFHIHENGDCASADFSSAGGHFSPEGHEHGAPTDDQHHTGDLGNLEAGPDGVATAQMEMKLELSADAEDSILGKAVIIHEKADDMKSQPSGAAGPRVACGVIGPKV